MFLISAVLVPIAVLVTVLACFLFLPLPAALPEPKAVATSRQSIMLDASGKQQIGVFRRFESSIPFRKEDLPKILKDAVVSAEDKHFYEHGGVDPRGTARAFWADYRNKKLVQGGSTITQQYVKLAYTTGERTVWRKLREAILASQLDRQYDKDEILYRYLSMIYLGNGAYGVEAASELYFRKPVSQLNVSEAALLAGLIPAPSRYEPLGNPTLAEQKRRIVLRKMQQEGYITFQQLAEADSQGIWTDTAHPPPVPHTLVYRPIDQTALSRYPYFRNYVEQYLKDRYGDRLYTGGLTIQTTLDLGLQAQAEQAVAKGLGPTKAPLEMALAAVEPPTGYVKAMVGGRDFAGGSQVNLALGGCPTPNGKFALEVRPTCLDTPVPGGGGKGRQPGSAFKPFTLATALSQGVSPNKVYPAPRAFLPPGCKSDACAIHNSEGEGGSAETIRAATVASVNTVYAQIIRDVGVKNVAEMAKKLGITSAFYQPGVHGLSYTLGVIDVSPLDMASAYGVFATAGKRAAPTPVLRVVDANGRILEDNTKPAQAQVLDPAVADNVTDILRGVITSGTGTRANIGRPAAGKTGTGQNYTNAWFVGYTPTLSTAVWMGYSDNQKTPLVRINGVGRVFGGTIPAATWHEFMADALKDVPVTDFSQPAPIKAPVLEDLRRQARGGIDPGPARRPAGTPNNCGGPCETGPGTPRAVAPPRPTTTTQPGSTFDTLPP